MFVDSHCHLNFSSFKEQEGDAYTPKQLIQRALDAKISLMQSICTHPDEFEEILAIAEEFDSVVCSFGVHPHDAEAHTVSVEQIFESVQHPKVIGIGETGLDYYYDNAPRKKQRESFEKHLEAALEVDIPVIIHLRDAEDDMMDMLKNVLSQGSPKLLFHCFTGSDKVADFGIEHGIYFSASGILTFKNAEDLRQTFARIPPKTLLIETDAPFLAPVPHRGKLNEPSFVPYTAACLADLKGLSIEELAQVTTDNFFTLFNKAEVFRS
jgi:TatD DNase family protein